MGKKEIRRKFRDETFARDNYKCKICGAPMVDNNMDAHHITDRNEMPNGGYVMENGITVCNDNGYLDLMTGEFVESCHMRVEKFHITGGEEWEKNLHPDDLYELIGSSKELAIEKSLKL